MHVLATLSDHNHQHYHHNVVSANVALGFPMSTLDGLRGEPDDPILDIRSPTLFVVGQNGIQAM